MNNCMGSQICDITKGFSWFQSIFVADDKITNEILKKTLTSFQEKNNIEVNLYLVQTLQQNRNKIHTHRT